MRSVIYLAILSILCVGCKNEPASDAPTATSVVTSAMSSIPSTPLPAKPATKEETGELLDRIWDGRYFAIPQEKIDAYLERAKSLSDKPLENDVALLQDLAQQIIEMRKWQQPMVDKAIEDWKKALESADETQADWIKQVLEYADRCQKMVKHDLDGFKGGLDQLLKLKDSADSSDPNSEFNKARQELWIGVDMGKVQFSHKDY